MPKPKGANVVAWSDYLDELLKAARDASGAADVAAINTVIDALTDFELSSPWEARALDQIALETAIGLAIADLHLRTEQLKARERDFVAIYDLVQAAAKKGGK